MNKKKEYLIELFIKKATAYHYTVASLKKSFEILIMSYPDVPQKEVEELRQRFSIEKYIKKISPVIDEKFSEEELKEIIDFYTTKAGAKLLDHAFLKSISNMADNMFSEIEEEFRKRNGRTR